MRLARSSLRSVSDHRERNAAERERMQRLMVRLSDEDLHRDADDGWTVAATFAHIAFWDRVSRARWEAALRPEGPGFVSYPQELIDWVNAAALPQWRSLAPRAALMDALSAAADVDALIERLPTPTVDEALATGRARMLDRSVHRRDHLDRIERALG